MYLALESTVPREGARIADRIVAAFKDSVVREGLNARLQMTYAISGFPDETADEERYLRNVFDREAA